MKTKFCAFFAALLALMLTSGCATQYYRFNDSGEEHFVVAHSKCKAKEKQITSSTEQQVVSALTGNVWGALAAGDAAYEACMIEMGWAPCKDAPISENRCE